MRRYDTKLDDGTFLIEWDGDWLEIGEMDALRDLFGGDVYEIEYGDKQARMPWLEDELEDNTLTFDVTETLLEMDFEAEFVEEVAAEPLDEIGAQGHPVRTEAFAEKMMAIWDAQGRDDEDA